jgi:opacity protein-like surface antigen
MKRFYLIIQLYLLGVVFVNAQTNQFGISGGISNFLGDLGKKPPNGRFYFGDVEASLFRPAFGVFYRHGFNKFLAIRTSAIYGRLQGDDRLSNYKKFMDDAWIRKYRNLHFKSYIFEIAALGEINLMPYEAGNIKKRFAPYITAGVALFSFNPKADYKGEKISLQPLGTEGQGLPGYAKKYSLIQLAFPVGFGLKYNLTQFITVALDFGHRFTLTDYVDNVSTVYPNKTDVFGFYEPKTAQKIYELSRRSTENDLENLYGNITSSGSQRGNPKGKDAYLFSMFSLSYVLGKKPNENNNNPMDKKPTKRFNRKSFDRNLKQ